MPDFFDRLVACSVPGAEPPDLVRARPRLPGPFERPAPAAAEPELEPDQGLGPAPASLPPVVGAPPPAAAALVEQSAFTRLVPQAYRAGPPPPGVPAAPVGLLVPPAPPPRPSDPDGPRRDRGDAPASAAPPRLPADQPLPRLVPPPSPGPLVSAAAMAAPGPAPAPTEIRVVPVPQPTGRREPRPPERTVQVRIGRIEVVAPQPEPPRSRPGRAERRPPLLTLDRYLAGEPGSPAR